MLITFATLALLTLFLGLAACGAWLLWRGRGRWRLAGAALLLEGLLALAAQALLSTYPVGIGEPLIRVPFAATLLQAAATLAAVIGVGALVVWLARWAARRFATGGRRGAAFGALLVSLPLIAGLALYGLVVASTPVRERERNPGKRQITLPRGFTWSIYAEGTMDNPTCMAFGPDGNLYIGDIAGDLWLAKDTNGDKHIDSITKFADGFQLLVGLAWRGNDLYAASAGKIEVLRDTNGDGVADQRRTIVEGLPSMILRPHTNGAIAFGPDGRLYFGVGSTTNGDYEPNPLAAAVLSVNPDGSDLKVFARGFGNTFGVAFNRDGALFGGDNSSGDEPDEFNQIVEGGNYGYPYFYGDPPKNLGTIGPLATFPAHSSPTGVAFYGGAQFPKEYRDNAFVALWNRGEVARIEVAKTTGGQYLSRTSTFASGFLYPLAVTTGPDGDLYVADFGTTAIYRISYTPGP